MSNTVVLSGEEEIRAAQLITLRRAVILEEHGLQHSSGISATSRAKKLLDLAADTSRPRVLRALENYMREHNIPIRR